MANTRLGPEGTPIGDPNQDLDYIPRLGNLVTAAETAPRDGERFIERFDWTPQWKGEVTLALDGLETRVNQAARRHIRGVEDTLEQAEGYKKEALRDATIPRLAFAVRDESSSLSASEIRDNPDILRVLAKQQLFRNSLQTGKWPGRQKNNLEKRLNPFILKLYGAEDEALIKLWHETTASANMRGRFWIDELNKVQNNPWVLSVRKEAHQRMISR